MRAQSLVALAVILTVACGDDTPMNPGGSTTNQIQVRDNSFDPASTTVALNTTVTWTWAGANQHNVTFDNQALGASSTITTGTYTKQFTSAGTFGYRCTIHPGMNGSIAVQ